MVAKFEFIGHLADTATNIRHGKGGSKILIEVPENEIYKITNLMFMQQTPLKITMEPATDAEINEAKNDWKVASTENKRNR